MARFDAGTQNGTGQISTLVARVKSINFQARTTNTGSVYVGRSDVTVNNGYELKPGKDITLNFDDGSELFNAFYTAGAGQVDWVVILE